MRNKYLLGVDVGTYSSKGVVINTEGRGLGQAWTEHGVDSPRPGWYEQDADQVWWEDFRTICRELVRNVDPRRIAAVGVSALMPDMLPVDESGQPLRKGILYGIDTRATEEIAEMVAELGQEKILDVTGNRLTAQQVGPKIIWFRRHQPELYERTRKIHSASSYLVYKLTGHHVLDYQTAGGFGPFFNLGKLAWDEEMCKRYDVSLELLPGLAWSTEVAGEVTHRAAEETGLVEGTPVIVGATDSAADSISVGAVGRGTICLTYGSTMCFMANLNRPHPHPALECGPGVLPDTYWTGGGMATSAALTTWFRDNFGQIERDVEAKLNINAYQILSKQAEQIGPGAQGLVILPYFAGERTPVMDPWARGTIIGLTLSHSRGHLYRALLEGVAYGLRHCLETMADAGIQVDRIISLGGGTRSKVWTQIVSDVIGIDQQVSASTHGAPYGDAYLAGLGVGVFPDLEKLRKKWVHIAETVTHRPDVKREVYDKYYRVYRDLYGDVRQIMHTLARLP